MIFSPYFSSKFVFSCVLGDQVFPSRISASRLVPYLFVHRLLCQSDHIYAPCVIVFRRGCADCQLNRLPNQQAAQGARSPC